MKALKGSIIQTYCQYTNSKFMNYSGGVFTFQSAFGGRVSFTQTELIEITRSLLSIHKKVITPKTKLNICMVTRKR